MSATSSDLPIAPGSSPAAAAAQVMPALRAVCGALAGGVAAFAAVVTWFFLDGQAPLSPGGLPEVALLVAVGLAAALFAAAPVVERRLREAPPDASMSDVAARFQTATVAGFALREGAGLFGLVVALLSGTLSWALGFAAASVAAMALAWPKRADLEARLRKAAARG